MDTSGGIFLEKITLNFSYTRKEYIQAVRQYMFLRKRLRPIDPWLAATFLLVSIIAMIFTNFSGLAMGGFMLAAIFSAMVFGLHVFLPGRQWAAQDKLKEPYRIIFSPDRIVFRTGTIDSTILWKTFYFLLESPEFFYLLQKSGAYTVLPKRSFGGLRAQAAFRDLAEKAMAEAIKAEQTAGKVRC